MNWAGAIEVNQAALTRILATLFAALGLAGGGTVARLPKPLYTAALWVLRPLEAAVRRLIVIAARGLKVKLPPVRPMPKGLVIAGKGEGRHSFQLFDARKRFGQVGRERAAAKAEPATPKPDDSMSAMRLCRRLATLQLALETLQAQAKRMARWKARRAGMQGFVFRSPLRPGPPPGHRKRGKEELDQVLKECHGLAWDALREDTS
jgi:hypothetical protein